MGYRPRVRPLTAARYDLFPPITTLGWRAIRKVTAAQAIDAMEAGRWREVVDEDGQFAGYQINSSPMADVARESSRSISKNELELNAGAHMKDGHSRTIKLPEDRKLGRIAKALQPEDAVERAIRKVESWPFPASRKNGAHGAPVFGDRAVRAYPKAARAC